MLAYIPYMDPMGYKPSSYDSDKGVPPWLWKPPFEWDEDPVKPAMTWFTTGVPWCASYDFTMDGMQLKKKSAHTVWLYLGQSYMGTLIL